MQSFFSKNKKIVCISTISLTIVIVCCWVYFAHQPIVKFTDEQLNGISSVVVDSDTQQEYRAYSIPDNSSTLLMVPNQLPERLTFKSEISIEYPKDGVRGIYVSAHSAGSEYFNELVNLVNKTKLNTMVIDVKEDLGKITMNLASSNPLIEANTVNYITDPQKMMATLQEHQIYPIARIVVFKDTLLANKHPEWSFTHSYTEQLWVDGNDHAFVNPFEKAVWDYNIEIAIAAAKMGFKEIQFDYIRFPEGFAVFEDELEYTTNDYAHIENKDEARVQVINDFLSYAREKLKHYNVAISADVFGYTATIGEDSGIGQNFIDIASRVDVISSMVYPSHWGDAYFGLVKPDLYPYEVIYEYAAVENQLLASLKSNKPQTRPWLQDFTATYLGATNYMHYGAPEVSLQIEALRAQNIYEYLLWDSTNEYSYDANY